MQDIFFWLYQISSKVGGLVVEPTLSVVYSFVHNQGLGVILEELCFEAAFIFSSETYFNGAFGFVLFSFRSFISNISHQKSNHVSRAFMSV